MHAIGASARYSRAIHSTAELLAKLRIESIFVGSVARGAWLGESIERGSIDLLALMNPQQKNQLAMMASNRGFRLERDEIEQSAELDLVPLHFVDPEGDVRVHVLLASNALYGRMVAAGVISDQIADRRSQIAEDQIADRRSQIAGESEGPAGPARFDDDALATRNSQLAPPAASPAIRDLRSAISSGAISIRVARAEDLALLLLMSEDHEAVERLSNLPGFDRAAFEERLVAIGLSEWAVRA
jgi:hypothetical protein